MNPIRFPRAAVQLVAAAGEHDPVQIKQLAGAAVLTITTGSRVLRLSATALGDGTTVEPFTITAGDMARASVAVGLAGPGPAHELPLVVVRISPTIAGIAGPSGTPQTVTLVQATLSDPSGPIDAVEGELASGMTRAVAAAEPQQLQQIAELALAIGCTAVQFTFAPRFGSVLAEVDAGTVAAAVLLGGGKCQQPEPARAAVASDDDPLVFTMPDEKPRGATRRAPRKTAQLFTDEELPF
jgi:hypothetical protein